MSKQFSEVEKILEAWNRLLNDGQPGRFAYILEEDRVPLLAHQLVADFPAKKPDELAREILDGTLAVADIPVFVRPKQRPRLALMP